jgi:hypothetical protein
MKESLAKYRPVAEAIAKIFQPHVEVVIHDIESDRVDLCIDSALDPYDYFATAAVISGAGGQLTDWDGNEVTLDWFGHILASGDRRCHDAVLELLNFK